MPIALAIEIVWSATVQCGPYHTVHIAPFMLHVLQVKRVSCMHVGQNTCNFYSVTYVSPCCRINTEYRARETAVVWCCIVTHTYDTLTNNTGNILVIFTVFTQ